MGRKKSEATLQAVAKAANVSLSTASNVMNGRFQKMSQTTREAVEAEIARLNYRPAGDARAMRLEKRMVVGMLILDRSEAFMTDPYISQIVAGFSETLWRQGYVCMVDGVQPENFEGSPLLRFAHTDGICVFQSGQVHERRQVLDHLSRIGEPVVAIEEPDLPDTEDIATTRHDNLSASRELASALRSGGGKRALLMTPGWIWPAMASRIAGIKETFGAEEVEELRCGDGSLGAGISALEAWLRAQPGRLPVDCVIAGTDRLGFALEKVAEAVPDLAALALGGFHSINQRHLPVPAIKLARLPAYDLGKSAAEMLISRITTGSFAERRCVVPPPAQEGE